MSALKALYEKASKKHAEAMAILDEFKDGLPSDKQVEVDALLDEVDSITTQAKSLERVDAAKSWLTDARANLPLGNPDDVPAVPEGKSTPFIEAYKRGLATKGAVQKSVLGYNYAAILQLGGKRGVVNSSMVSTRVRQSGRAVLVSNADYEPEWIGLPNLIFTRLDLRPSSSFGAREHRACDFDCRTGASRVAADC